jgi:hypothetical protein
VLGSNPDRDTCYHDWRFPRSFSVPGGKYWDSTPIGSRSLPSKSSSLHRSSYNPTRYNLDNDSVVKQCTQNIQYICEEELGYVAHSERKIVENVSPISTPNQYFLSFPCRKDTFRHFYNTSLNKRLCACAHFCQWFMKSSHRNDWSHFKIVDTPWSIMLWHVGQFLGNDRQISNHTTAVAK